MAAAGNGEEQTEFYKDGGLEDRRKEGRSSGGGRAAIDIESISQRSRKISVASRQAGRRADGRSRHLESSVRVCADYWPRCIIYYLYLYLYLYLYIQIYVQPSESRIRIKGRLALLITLISFLVVVLERKREGSGEQQQQQQCGPECIMDVYVYVCMYVCCAFLRSGLNSRYLGNI
ncbi:hypothetical protein F4779DRAFT_486328 [Xylariaceae sp. FL0662B]|nr:hypothetical protein F4779DRAFT_486328 [Xylariaceae sp. FL0662B]